MNRVLIITYYWPPSGGVGVQRWLKFSKYLRNYGWEPIIYTPLNPEIPALDYTLEKDIKEGTIVLKKKIWEPYTLYKNFLGLNKETKIGTGFLSETKKPGLLEKVSIWIRGNLFIPDARVMWVKPSIKYLSDYIKENKVDAIVSTGTPHSMHLIALGIKQKNDIPWIADFRDAWRFNDYYDKLMLSKWADKVHRKKEKKVLDSADAITTVGWQCANYFYNMGYNNVKIITNGYDEDDFLFDGNSCDNDKKENKFIVSHIGYLNKDRNPEMLWKVLNKMINRNNDLKKDIVLNIIGQVDINVIDSIRKNGLYDICRFTNHLPHNEVIKEMLRSSLLLLLLNRTIDVKARVTYKIFEYMASGKPILCIGDTNGDAAKILNDTASGYSVNFDDEEKIEEYLNILYLDYKKGNESFINRNVEKYSYKNLTKELVALLEKIRK